MRFVYDKKVDNEAISFYTVKNGTHYTVIYIDGHYEEFDTNDPTVEKELLDKMVIQAITRELKYTSPDIRAVFKDLNVQSMVFGVASLLSGYLTYQLATGYSSNDLRSSATISAIITALGISKFIDIKRKKVELKKFRIFLDMLAENKDILEQAINDAYKTHYGEEAIYYPQVNKPDTPEACINYLDVMPMSLVRTIKKEYKKIEKEQNV